MEHRQRQLYNRQIYAVGEDTQKKYGMTSVLIAGLSGLGCEIAKNLILTGVKSVTLADTSPIKPADLSSLFFADESCVGRPRAATIAPKLMELNRFVKVTVEDGPINEQLVAKHTVAIFVDKPTTQLHAQNAWCRSRGIGFVACESRSAAGCIFVDGGDNFSVVDYNGEDLVTCIVTGITEDGTIICHDDRKHECEEGDEVYFTGFSHPSLAFLNTTDQERKLFKVTSITGPTALQIAPPPELHNCKGSLHNPQGGFMHTTKKQINLKFKSLSDAVAQPEFAFVDDTEDKLTAASMLHAMFRALHLFIVEHQQRLPEDSREVQLVVQKALEYEPSLNQPVVTALLSSCTGNLSPMACFIGGLASQEVLKLCSGKFTPVKQWLYYDVREVLATTTPAPTQPSRYEGQIRVIGPEVQEKLGKANVFVVGAGALGCEFLKNFACMGVSCSGGKMTVTDMDHIELSNLSRQLLFRTQHIGQPKALVAAEVAHGINSNLNITPLEEKVSQETEATFNSEFWESQSFVCNALDNIIARRYVDSRCVLYKKALFESGTLGTKCNVQVVIPYLTESYSSSHDPPEKQTPICTLKNFPNAIEHTIQWAREAFFRFFSEMPRDINAYLEDPNFLTSLEKDPSNKSTVLANITKGLQERPKTPEDCIVWARRQFEDLFVHSIKQLLYNLPTDKVNDKGQPFWSGAKLPPKPHTFDATNQTHLDFITAAARLIGDVYGVRMSGVSQSDVKRVASSVRVEEFHPRVLKLAVTENDKTDEGQLTGFASSPNNLPPKASFGDMHLNALEFEKDNDENGHIDFMTAASNLRALNYQIPVADKEKTKKIAGNIIPAMVTTTSLVTGLVGFEIIKYVAGAKTLQAYRNSFINIALPLLTFTMPIAAPKVEYTKRDGAKIEWSLWDRLDVKEGKDLTLRQLLDLLKVRWDISVSVMSLEEGKLVYAEFAPNKARLAQTIGTIVKELTQGRLVARSVSFVLTGEVGGHEAEIPLLRYIY